MASTRVRLAPLGTLERDCVRWVQDDTPVALEAPWC